MTTAPASILIVEDDRTTRLLLNEILDGAGYETSTADNGSAALEAIAASPPALVLLDVWLPGMNGLDVMAKAKERGLSPKIVVMTSADTPQTVLRALKENAYQYVTKPVEPRRLLELIERALSSPAVPPITVVSARPNWVELTVPCDLATAERIHEFMLQLKADLSEEVRHSVGTVFREMLLNAIEWGGKLDPSQEVRVAYLRAKRMLLYRIADPGKGFSFDELSHAALGNPPDSPGRHLNVRAKKGLRAGGFGILIAREMIDELLYNEKHNEVVFVKYLD